MHDLDHVDHQILSILMENADLPHAEVAKQVHLTGGAVHARVKKLRDKGIILGANLRVDYDKLGYDICAFLGIYLDKSSLFDDVAAELNKIPEVVEAYYTTGLYNIFTKIICRDTNHLRDVLHDKIQKISGIQRTETFISLQQSLQRPVQIV